MSLEILLKEQPRIMNVADNLQVIDVGTIEYKEALAMQERLQLLRKNNAIPNTVVLCEHPEVYTVGTDVKEGELTTLIRKELEHGVVSVKRGGKITYHGPGQIVAYFICKLPFDKYAAFITDIEDIAIATLRRFGIEAYSRKEDIDPRTSKRGIRGAWYDLQGVQKKIVAQGLQMDNAGREYIGIGRQSRLMVVTMHGFALNGNTDLTKFERIYPCGFQHDVMTSMKVILGRKIDMWQVRDEIVAQLGKYANKW